MAQRVKHKGDASALPGTRTFGPAAVTARQQFSWIWSRESLLRLGLSFVLAVALWLYITSKTDPTQAWDFPVALSVNAINTGDQLTITNNLDLVHVRVQADRSTTPVSQSSFHPFVDLSGYGRGLHYVKVTVLTDPGIKILNISPSSIPVMLEPVKSATVPVHISIFGSPPKGYTAGPYRVNPGAVTVTGPSAAVSQLSQAVAFVPISGSSSSVSGDYSLVLKDRSDATLSSHLLTVHPSTVHVSVPVTLLSSFKTLPVVASIQGQPKPGFGVVGITIRPANITAYGSPGQLSGTSSVLTAPVWVSNRGAGSFTTRVRVHLPKGVHANSSWVSIRVQIRPVQGSSSIEVGITPENALTGLVVHTRPATVLVTVVGPSNRLQTAARQMRGVVDLTGLAAGTYYLQPRVETPPGLAIKSVYPTTVTVVLSPTTAG